MNPIYLDYNATTPVDPAVADAVSHALRELWGNPSSSHAYGKAAHDAVEIARGQVAALIGAQPDEIVFTGGGSEASNQAIKGTCLRRPRGFLARLFGGKSPDAVHIITTAVEHPATLEPVEFLRRLGTAVTILPVDQFGLVDPGDVKRAFTSRTRLVTIMHSNNEVGTLMPIQEIAALCRERGVLLHTDCAVARQGAGGRERTRRRSAHHRGAQAVRTERCRGALRPSRRAARTAYSRGRARERPPRRYREHAVHRRPR